MLFENFSDPALAVIFNSDGETKKTLQSDQSLSSSRILPKHTTLPIPENILLSDTALKPQENVDSWGNATLVKQSLEEKSKISCKKIQRKITKEFDRKNTRRIRVKFASRGYNQQWYSNNMPISAANFYRPPTKSNSSDVAQNITEQSTAYPRKYSNNAAKNSSFTPPFQQAESNVVPSYSADQPYKGSKNYKVRWEPNDRNEGSMQENKTSYQNLGSRTPDSYAFQPAEPRSYSQELREIIESPYLTNNEVVYRPHYMPSYSPQPGYSPNNIRTTNRFSPSAVEQPYGKINPRTSIEESPRELLGPMPPPVLSHSPNISTISGLSSPETAPLQPVPTSSKRTENHHFPKRGDVSRPAFQSPLSVDYISSDSDSEKNGGRNKFVDILLKMGCFLVIAFILSVIIVVIVGFINRQKCIDLSLNEDPSHVETHYINDTIGSTPWKFATVGKFISAVVDVQQDKFDENRIYFETMMRSAKGGDTYVVDQSHQGEFLFVHGTPSKSPNWENYLTFPPTCAKVQIKLYFAKNATFQFSLKTTGFEVNGWPS
ncbi:hypothetical protein G9A89_015261 [Geosiphon pyriformis]|nr:hypothetical protein G9A89_015261 [Geosiphon pyriformis]